MKFGKSSRELYPADFFTSNKKLLFWSGLWLNKKRPSKTFTLLYRSYSAWILFYCVIGFPLAVVYYLPQTWGSIFCFIKTSNMVGIYFSSAIKYFVWFKNQKKLKKIMKKLNDPQYHYDSIQNEFTPWKTFQSAKKVSNLFTYSFFYVAILVAIASAVPILFFFIYDPNFITLPENPDRKIFGDRLTHACWWPLDITKSHLAFLEAYILESFPIFGEAVVISCMVTLFASIVNCCTAHFVVLQGAFRTVRVRAVANVKEYLKENKGLYDPPVLDHEIKIQLKKCIVHLQDVIKIVRDVEDVFTIMVLAQAMTTLLEHCTCLYMVQMVPMDNAMFIGQWVYLVAIAFEFFLFCWFGNELLLNSVKVADGVYESDWFLLSMSNKRTLKIAMSLGMRKVFITVGKFTPLSITTMLTILKTSFSYYTVLRQINNEDHFSVTSTRT